MARRNPTPWALNHSTPASRKRCVPLNCWTVIMKKHFLLFFPQRTHPELCSPQSMQLWQWDYKDLKNFFQGHFDTNTPKKNDCPNNHQPDRGQPSSRNCITFTPCDDAHPPSTTNPAFSCHSSECPHGCSCSIPCCDTCLPGLNNPCRFCKDCAVKWTDCSMHNPATGSQTTKGSPTDLLLSRPTTT